MNTLEFCSFLIDVAYLSYFVYFLAGGQCKLAAFTGVSCIMIRETEETFGIITQDIKFRGIPLVQKNIDWTLLIF